MKRLVLCNPLLLIALLTLLLNPLAYAQQSNTEAPGTLTVGTKPAPPFAMKDDDGKWHGISIDLMEIVASTLNYNLTFTEKNLSELISDVEDGRIDASIAAISVTPEREKVIDFTHQYYGSGLAIATPEQNQPGWKNMLLALVSPHFLATIFLLCCVLSFVGVVIWLLEAKRNSDQFGDSAARGIGNGFWFAAVTMTTVGYGDKAPVTLPGRVVSVVWMFAALILTAFLTAQLTTILTAQSATNLVTGVNDLRDARVGNVRDSASQRYFTENGIRVTGFDNMDAGLQAVADGKLDAFVHDQPLLQWRSTHSEQAFLVLPEIFDPQSYAIVVAQDSSLREDLNVALLEVLTSHEWIAIKKRYLGW